MSIISLTVALKAVRNTLAQTCHIMSRDVCSRGQTTTLVICWDTYSTAFEQETVSTCSRYRKKSPSEIKHDTQRAVQFLEKKTYTIFQSDSTQQFESTEKESVQELFKSRHNRMPETSDRMPTGTQHGDESSDRHG